MRRTDGMEKAKKKLEKWELLETSEVFTAAPWLKVHVDCVKLPGGRIVDDYYRVELQEYAMIYARRDDGKVLFERQYKHGLKEVSIVLPTGTIEQGEMPVEAAKREFFEETGYTAEKWSYVGTFLVDGNKGCGRGHFYIADGLEKVSEPVYDDMEDLEIIFMEPQSAMEYILESNTSELATPALLAFAGSPHVMKFRGIE